MAASWNAHVKETHKKLGGSYKDALKAARKTWKKKGAAAKPARRGRKKAAVGEEEVDEKEEAPAPKRRRKKARPAKQIRAGARAGPQKGYKGIN